MGKKYIPKKNKTTAILISIFFGMWVWLYTYKYDSWKFWLNLVLAIVTVGVQGIVAWIWAIIDVATKPKEYYEEYYS